MPTFKENIRAALVAKKQEEAAIEKAQLEERQRQQVERRERVQNAVELMAPAWRDAADALTEAGFKASVKPYDVHGDFHAQTGHIITLFRPSEGRPTVIKIDYNGRLAIENGPNGSTGGCQESCVWGGGFG